MERKRGMDIADRSDQTLGDPFPGFQISRQAFDPHGLCQKGLVLPGQFNQFLRLMVMGHHGLFTKHRLMLLQALFDDFIVQVIGQSHINEIDRRVIDQVGIGIIGLCRMIPEGKFLGPVHVPGGNGGQTGPFDPLQSVGKAVGNSTQAYDAISNRYHRITSTDSCQASPPAGDWLDQVFSILGVKLPGLAARDRAAIDIDQGTGDIAGGSGCQ